MWQFMYHATLQVSLNFLSTCIKSFKCLLYPRCMWHRNKAALTCTTDLLQCCVSSVALSLTCSCSISNLCLEEDPSLLETFHSWLESLWNTYSYFGLWQQQPWGWVTWFQGRRTANMLFIWHKFETWIHTEQHVIANLAAGIQLNNLKPDCLSVFACSSSSINNEPDSITSLTA